jgi:hypothetical protein
MPMKKTLNGNFRELQSSPFQAQRASSRLDEFA